MHKRCRGYVIIIILLSCRNRVYKVFNFNKNVKFFDDFVSFYYVLKCTFNEVVKFVNVYLNPICKTLYTVFTVEYTQYFPRSSRLLAVPRFPLDFRRHLSSTFSHFHKNAVSQKQDVTDSFQCFKNIKVWIHIKRIRVLAGFIFILPTFPVVDLLSERARKIDARDVRKNVIYKNVFVIKENCRYPVEIQCLQRGDVLRV